VPPPGSPRSGGAPGAHIKRTDERVRSPVVGGPVVGGSHRISGGCRKSGLALRAESALPSAGFVVKPLGCTQMIETAGFRGLPDDLARLAVQRLMTCDVRWRAHERAARMWQAVASTLAVVATVTAALAAVSFVQDVGWLAVALSIAVAIFVPLEIAIGASGRAAQSRSVAADYEGLSNDYERYVQLDLGPPMWERQDAERLGHPVPGFGDRDVHRATIDRLDTALRKASSRAPRVRFRQGDLVATESRAKHLIDYLEMENVVLPERPVWSH
jgi:hypothetical protein